MTHFQVLIIGGGNAGISTAAQLLGKKRVFKLLLLNLPINITTSPPGHLWVLAFLI